MKLEKNADTVWSVDDKSVETAVLGFCFSHGRALGSCKSP
jgi:hypothetical protein